MFTGIIEEIGIIIRKSQNQGSANWSVKATKLFMADVKIGDSISVQGVCQTVTSLTSDSFEFYSSPTTLKLSTLANLTIGSAVNLEKALCVGQRLGGHFVYGHIEGQGKVINIVKDQETIALSVEIPEKLRLFVVETGSIALDGVSLTVASYNFPHITVQVIPHTWHYTTLSSLKKSSPINIETDILSKYILGSTISHHEKNTNKTLKEALLEQGFIK